MHITRVELENFKSHERSVFEFARGTTSITGENGAGKTSILEAIAWTVFDTLDYKKSDIVRRGAKKAAVRVTLESGLDERAYTIYRDTGTGYNVYDPRLDTRIADKKEEVTRFLWQHLGIEPGTDLESLFKQAIGVPQGTFTAIFLAAATERKKTFDTLLKVEEYRQSSDELLKTVRFVEQQVAAVDVSIARAEGEISRIGPLESEVAVLSESIVNAERSVASTVAALSRSQAELELLDRLEEDVRAARSIADRSQAELSRAELSVKHHTDQLEKSREAAARLESVRSDATAHEQATGRLKELERESLARQTLVSHMSKTEAAISSVVAEQKHLHLEIDRIAAARTAVAELAPRAQKHDELRAELERSRADLIQAETAFTHLKSLDEQIVSLRETYKRTSEELAMMREKAAAAGLVESLEGRESVIVSELAGVKASLDRDRAFQREIKNGLCPVLSEKCLNLKEGQTLDGFLSSKFDDLQGEIDRLSIEHTKIGGELKAARDARRFEAQASLLAERLKEIEHEGTSLRDRRPDLEKDGARVETLRISFSAIETELNELDDAKARLAIAQEEIAREAELRERLSEIEKNLERLETDRRIADEDLETYRDLDGKIEETTRLRDLTAEAFRAFLSSEALAGQAATLEAELETHAAERDRMAEAALAAEDAYEKAAAAYDRDKHLAQRSQSIDLQKKLAESTALLEADRRRHLELIAELERLSEIRSALRSEFKERERLNKIAETTEFIRTTLKEAAPLVARNYVHHVSVEANRLFREIGGDPERTLKWGEDYAISVEEGGYDRPFQSLSGGEQMAAAMAVRLALLKQLSDIRIAFFDEPTTNMDAERRENLAQQIGQITNFDQLFVISHDDTFEGYMDHEIRVGE
ncbi:MAG TPA: SMC family ATPase [Pyrinomonadaceae bacterium]|nr:SMC family ATPase [Pyrinomonadaceae bacterium]